MHLGIVCIYQGKYSCLCYNLHNTIITCQANIKGEPAHDVVTHTLFTHKAIDITTYG